MRTLVQRNAIAGTGASIDGIDHGVADISATPSEVAVLRRLGFTVTAAPTPTPNDVGANDFPSADSAYHNYSEMNAEIDRLQRRQRSRDRAARRGRAGRQRHRRRRDEHPVAGDRAASGTLSLSLSYCLAHGSNASSAEYLRVSIVTASGTTVVLNQVGAASNRNGAWTAANVDPSSFKGQSVRILVEAAEAAGASLVEAGIDDVSRGQRAARRSGGSSVIRNSASCGSASWA